jgi:hypothetical protein
MEGVIQMRRAFAAVVALLVLGSGSNVEAQSIQGGVYSPPVSPYIQLLRQGASPGLNYANLVQPQMTFFNALNRNPSSYGSFGPNASTGASGDLVTGHPVQFMNYTHFFTPGGINTGYGTGAQRPGMTGAFGAQGMQGFGRQVGTPASSGVGAAPAGSSRGK